MDAELANGPSEMEIYLFDLRGYLHLEGALSQNEIAELNATLDALPPIKKGEWYGYIHGHMYGETDGPESAADL